MDYTTLSRDIDYIKNERSAARVCYGGTKGTHHSAATAEICHRGMLTVAHSVAAVCAIELC